MSHTKTPHADFYILKGLIASSHPECLELIAEAERRYSSHEGLVQALEDCLPILEALDISAELGEEPLPLIRRVNAALAAGKGQLPLMTEEEAQP